MNPDRWKQIDHLFHAALECEPGQRAAFLEKACAGDNEVYERRFSGPGVPLKISRAGGKSPKWRRDGRELYSVSNDRKLMAVEIKTAPTLQAGAPKLLFESPQSDDCDVSADGQRFLFAIPAGKGTSSVNLIINWTQELKR
jgi:hypothetical protein